MSKKISASSKKSAPVKAKKAVGKVDVAVSSPVRYSALPKLTVATPAAKAEVTFEQIAVKAYELFAAGRGDSELDNWLAAEAELKAAA